MMSDLLDSAVMVFNTNGGPVELHQARDGERATTLVGVMEAVRVLLEQNQAIPRAYTLTKAEWMNVASMRVSFGHLRKDPG